MSLTLVLLLGGGLALLVAGAELLVRGAARLAALLAVSPLVIGLTVVAYGTSAPELAVSLQAGLHGQADVALGNVLGSNVFNLLFILGLAAMLVPLRVSERLVRLDVPIMIGASLLLPAVAWDGRVGALEGALLVVAGLAYTVFLIVEGRREGRGGEEPPAATGRLGAAGAALLVLAGLGMLALGSRWLVAGATALARSFGVSELVIGLTVVAAGTSLPEVAASVAAGLRGQRDIAIGNVVGSNVFNILWVLGLAAAVSPEGMAVAPQALALDIPVVVAVALACLPIFFSGYTVTRAEGALFFVYYLAYTGYLVLAATGSAALPTLTTVLEVVVPLTIVTLLVLMVHAARRPPGPGAS